MIRSWLELIARCFAWKQRRLNYSNVEAWLD